MENNQPYNNRAMYGGQNQPNSGQPNGQQNSYGQYGQQNTPADFGQRYQGVQPTNSAPTNYPGSSYPQGGQPQYDRNMGGQMLSQSQNYNYPQYEGQPQQYVQPIAAQNYPSMPNYRQDGGVNSMSAHISTGIPQIPERSQQNYGSHHETSAPVGQINMSGQYGMYQRQPDYVQPLERSYGVNAQPTRNEGSMGHTGYGQQPISARPVPPMVSQINVPSQQQNDQNLIGGFLRQNSGQAQMPGMQYNASSTMDASGMNEGMPQFNISGNNNSSQPGFQYSLLSSNQTPNEMNPLPKTADPSGLDIGQLNRMAEYYATNSDYPKAIEYFEKMTSICRENGHAWTALGHCYLLKEDLHKSFQAYQNALYYLENIMDPQLWYGIGILYEKFESYEHAISSLMAVLKMSPNFYQKSEVLSRLGYIFAKTNDLTNAIVYFQNSILTNTFTSKRKVEILIKIGILHEEKGEYQEAQKSYEAALGHEEDNYLIYQHMAWNFYLQGNYIQANEFVNKAEIKNNEAEETYYIKARISQQTGNYEESTRIYSYLLNKNPNSALYWCSLAVLNYEQNLCEQAFEKIISATKLNGSMVESWYNFGILYEKCKQSDEATVAYKKAIDIDPEDNDARSRLISIQSPMYNPDNANLYMKFPHFRISNNLVIDRKYKKPQSQRPMQGVGGMEAESNMQYPTQASDHTDLQNYSHPGLQGNMAAYPAQTQPQNQYEEEKKYSAASNFPSFQSTNPAGQQFKPSTQYAGQFNQNQYQAMEGVPASEFKQAPAAFNQFQPAQPQFSGVSQGVIPQQNYGQPQYPQSSQYPPQAQSFEPSPAAMTQNYGTMNSQFKTAQAQDYAQYQNPNKIMKTEEFEKAPQNYPQPVQAQNTTRSPSVASKQPPMPSMDQNYLRSAVNTYHQTASSTESGQPIIPLNQIAQNLNTQANIPSLQSNLSNTSVGQSQPNMPQGSNMFHMQISNSNSPPNVQQMPSMNVGHQNNAPVQGGYQQNQMSPHNQHVNMARNPAGDTGNAVINTHQNAMQSQQQMNPNIMQHHLNNQQNYQPHSGSFQQVHNNEPVPVQQPSNLGEGQNVNRENMPVQNDQNSGIPAGHAQLQQHPQQMMNVEESKGMNQEVKQEQRETVQLNAPTLVHNKTPIHLEASSFEEQKANIEQFQDNKGNF